MNRATLLLTLAICALLASGADSCGAASNPTVKKAPMACEALSLNECAAAGCGLIEANRYEVDKVCRHSTEPVSCLSPGVACTEVMTHAKDLEGNTWLFGSGCIPKGWQYFQADEADSAAAYGPLCNVSECQNLPLNECAAAGCGLVRATRYEVDKVCRHSTEPVSCLPLGVECTAAMTHAKDLEGNTWLFGSGCIPKGWQHFQEDEADRAAADGPLCN